MPPLFRHFLPPLRCYDADILMLRFDYDDYFAFSFACCFAARRAYVDGQRERYAILHN